VELLVPISRPHADPMQSTEGACLSVGSNKSNCADSMIGAGCHSERSEPAHLDLNQHQVYDVDEVLQTRERLKLALRRSEFERANAVLTSLNERGPTRKLACSPNLERELVSMIEAYPQFRAVIRYVLSHIRLAQASRRPLRVPPLLIHGEPGLGKTHFAKALAQALGAPLVRYTFPGRQTVVSSLLGIGGMQTPTLFGPVFEAVCLGDYANPALLVDELDKASLASEEAVVPMLPLLESTTAATATDNAMGLSFDASLVTWIATANDLRAVPEVVRSRFRTFEAEMPFGEDAIRLARAVSASVLRRLTTEHVSVERGFAVAIAHLTPREMCQVIEDSLALALDAGRPLLQVEDLPEFTGAGRRSPRRAAH
jgi:ATP-dependent Lon protease